MAQLFVPPLNPSFAWEVEDKFSTIRNESQTGHRVTRARRDRKLRNYVLRWENANQATLEYLRAFVEFHLGEAVSFEYDLPCVDLYTPKPAFFAGTLAQGTGGSLADATYDVQYTFENTNGETEASPIQQIVIAAGGGTATIDFTLPPRLPADATLFGVYAETNPTAPKKQGTSGNPGAVFTISSIAAGAALPTVNAMQGRILATFTDEPRYKLVSAGVWVVELNVLEVLV